MRIQLLIYIISLFIVYQTRACLNTSQYKTFPVGVDEQTIYTVDIMIKRTSQGEGAMIFNLNRSTLNPTKEMWLLFVYECSYSFMQRPISCIPTDTVFVFHTSYIDSLKMVYSKTFKSVNSKHTTLELFKPHYISFCDLHKDCKMISLEIDTIKNIEYVSFEGISTPITINKDTTDVGWGYKPFYTESLDKLVVNSVRIYTLKKMKFVFIQITTEEEHQEYTSNCSHSNNKNNSEYKPSIPFKDIHTSVYEEPLVQHSRGFDVFVVQ